MTKQKRFLGNSTPTWVLIGFIVTAVIAINGVLAVRAVEELSDTQKSLLQTGEIMLALDDLHLLVLSAESGQRGFLLTEVEEYLLPYQDSLHKTQQRLDKISELRSEVSSQQKWIDMLIVLVSDKLVELQETVELALKGDQVGAIDQVMTGRGRELSSEIRGLFHQLKNEEIEYRNNLYQKLAAIKKEYRVTFIVSSVTSLIMLLLMLVLARQNLRNEERYLESLEVKSESKDRFLAHLSHELRTPLTSIMGYTELMLNDRKTREAAPDLNTVLNNCKHLLSLLNDLIDLSKIAENRLELNFTQVDLGHLIADVLSLMQVTADDKGVQLHFLAETALPGHINTDPTRLRQILINLIYNAIKFSPEGEVRLSVYTEMKADKELFYFRIEDTGCGIPEDKLASIFLPFEQIEDLVLRAEQGAGLGLAISAELAQRMGGKITAESTVGQGSQFTLSIDPGDLSDVARRPLCLETQSYSKSEQTSDNLQGHILVVDDVPDVQHLVGKLAINFGLSVSYASNGQEALDMLAQQNNRFDLIVMDIHMPELDGKQAIKAMRNKGYSQPVLALTAAIMKGSKEKLLSLGFTDVVSKPVDRIELNLRLSNALGQNDTCPVASSSKVLLIEDDLDAANITSLLLENMGAQVCIANTGEQALERFEQESDIDLVLLDLSLPDIDGIELGRRLRTIRPDTRMVILSGSEVRPDTLSELGNIQALIKPLNMQQLSELLELPD